MRVGKKPNVVEAKKTRSCVVRLEKVAKKSPNVSPAASEGGRSNITRTTRLSANTPTTTMAPTPKLRRGVAVATPQESKTVSGPIKKRIVGSNNLQTPQQQQQQKTTQSNAANIRSNQKIKIIPRSNKSTPVSTPSRDETPPPPTIAAGRSRRAIKPNPKYASEDLVTPKVVRNVATLGSSSTSRGGSVAPSGGKTRKASTSSDDFYNRNSDDEYDERHDMDNDEDDDIDDDADLLNDKAYQVNEKDDQDDSDFSDLEDEPVVRTVRPRGRPKRVQETTTTQTNNKTPQSTVNSQNKRITSSAAAMTTSSLRSAPSQLQQIRRSLVTANNQRNLNLLAGSGAGTAAAATAQKRKLQETLDDSSDNETSYTIKRKQLLLSNAAGNKVKVPVRENRITATSTPLNKNRVASNSAQQQQTVNGSSNKFSNNQTTNPRRAIEITAKSNNTQLRQSGTNAQQQQQQKSQTSQSNLTTQAKLLAAKTNRLRSGSPKLATQKTRQNNGANLAVGSNSTGTSGKTSLNTNSKISDKAKAQQPNNMKTKTSTSPASAATAATGTVNSENTIELKDDSPNSTMDDFETMPTFTIVNVNDIINKKGDVLITKTKANNNKAPTIIEFSESISLDDEEDDEDDEEDDDIVELKSSNNKKLPKLPTLNNRKEFGNKKSSSTSSSTAAPLTRSSESLRKLPTKPSATTQPAPQILNHKLGLRNTRVTAKTTTTLTATLTSPDKPAPRILNSMVAKKTQPVKPLIANMEDSADESFPLSLDEDDEEEEEEGEQQHEQQQQQEEETEDEVESRFGKQRQKLTEKTRKQREQNLRRDRDTEDTESQNTEEEESVLQTSNNSSNKANYNNTSPVALTPKQTTLTQRKRRIPAVSNTPIVVSSNKKRLTPAAAKENSLAATNQQVVSETTPSALGVTKPAITTPTLPNRIKTNNEKVVISKQGDKIIKKITCFETWYVINMPPETKRSTLIKNQLEMPLIRLANNAKNICLPNDLWSTKVTLYELSPQTLGKGTTYATFTGDLFEHNIKEEDRGKYQPSCVMFRRSIEKSQVTRMPYDRAVIFKNKTFYTNIEGKNVRLVGAPSIVNSEREIEILLQVVDTLTLQSDFVEHISIVP